MQKFITIVFLLFCFAPTFQQQQQQLDQGKCLENIFHGKLKAGLTTTEWKTPTILTQSDSSALKNEAQDDLILSLPGQPPQLSFKQFSGYVTVHEAKGRKLFYYFVEAEQNSSSKPLIIWLNGGPGCSSLGIGAMIEHGPFGVEKDGKSLFPRRYAWNKVANILYLESPIGVGFSYSATKSDYESIGDTRTAQDTYAFIIGWLQRFPQYRTSDFFIAGESYAGYYIPELIDVILSNSGAPLSLVPRLKGIMIGNGVADTTADLKGMFDYIRSHVMISEETHVGLVETCARRKMRPKCNDFLMRTKYEMGPIDLFNIVSQPSLRESAKADVGVYLNLPEVQKALHVEKAKIPYSWKICSMVSSNWTDTPYTILPIYKKIMKSGIEILLYSGDMDGVIPVTSTEYAIKKLNLTIRNSWRPWIDATGEVAGYKVDYDGLTFATVRGAGHEVSADKPVRAFSLLKWFIEGV